MKSFPVALFSLVDSIITFSREVKSVLTVNLYTLICVLLYTVICVHISMPLPVDTGSERSTFWMLLSFFLPVSFQINSDSAFEVSLWTDEGQRNTF